MRQSEILLDIRTLQSHLYNALRRQYTLNQRRWRQLLGSQLFGEVISFQVALKTVK